MKGFAIISAMPWIGETFLINPQGIHWLELVPSDIVTVDAKGNRIAGNRAVEPTAFFIHSRIHRAKPSARCIMHAHMPYATALYPAGRRQAGMVQPECGALLRPHRL